MRREDAAVRERAVCGREVDERDLAGAERERRHGGQRRADAETARVRLRRRDADELHHPRRGAVARNGQRLPQRVAGGLVLAGRKPVTLRRVNRRVHAGHLRAGHVSLIERGGKHQWLEGRARLTFRLHGAVERAFVEIAAAHHREHFAGARIDRHQRRFQAAFALRAPASQAIYLVELREPRGDRLFGVPLKRHVDRRINPQAALQHVFGAELPHDLAPHALEKMEPRRVRAVRGVRALRRGGVRVVPFLRERHRRRDRSGVLGVGHGAVLAHRLQHHVAPGLRHAWRDPWRADRRARNEAGQQRALGVRQIGGRFAEVAARRRFDAVVAVAQVDAVEIGLKDMLLIESALDAQREQRLFDFALDVAIGRQCDVPDELLRDGAAALLHRPRLQVDPRGAREADHVHACVPVEVAILGCEHCRNHPRGDPVERNVRAVLTREGKHQIVMPVVDERRFGRGVELQVAGDSIELPSEEVKRSETKHQRGCGYAPDEIAGELPDSLHAHVLLSQNCKQKAISGIRRGTHGFLDLHPLFA